MFQISITFVLVPLLIHAISSLSQKQPPETGNSVHMPTWFLIVGVGGSLVACLATVISIFVPFNTVATVVTASVAIVSAIFLLGYFSCRIQYTEEYICVTKFFSVKKYTYLDIQGIELRGYGGYCLLLDKGKVNIDGFAVGKEDFYEFIDLKYEELHDCRSIPVIDNKLFNGYIIEPKPHAVLLCLPCIGLICIALAGTWELSAIEIPQNLTSATFVAESAVDDGNAFVLIDGNREYRILESAICDRDALIFAVSQNQTIVVEYDVLVKTEEKEVLGIWSLQVNEKRFATYETVLEADIHDGIFTVTMLWVGAILCGMMVGAIFYILSHAPKYRFWAALLTKKEYRNF